MSLPNRKWLPPPPTWPRTLATLTLFLALASRAWSSEPQYPVAVMNWMVEGTFHALIVDKAQQRLSVWRIKDGEPTQIESYRCATGEKEGDKWVRGDMRTPEGVYFFCSVIDGSKLPPKYGLWACTTDYPNFVDRRRGKSGDGIWLHGRDKPLGPRPDSNGCVALENSDLIKVSRFIRLQSTPMIVVDQMLMAPRSKIIEQERELRGFVESWREAWESQDLERYMSHYSKNFQSYWLDFTAWKEKKRKLIKLYKKVEVKPGNVYLYRQNGLVTAIFTQAYQSDKYSATGIKVIYISHERGYRIYAEDYHRPVDDPNPVKTLLAGIGADTGPADEHKPEFRIKLVSTDEPMVSSGEETETPRAVAPSRGVVLDRFPVRTARTWSVPVLQTNEKAQTPAESGPMVVARTMPGDAPSQELPSHVRNDWRQTAGKSAGEHGLESAASNEPVLLTSRSESSPVIEPAVQGERKGPIGGDRKPVPEEGVSDKKASPTRDVMRFLEQWKSAWEEKKLDRYMKMYHPGFQAGAVSHEQLERSKRAFFRKYRTIRLEIEQVEVVPVNEGLRVKFLQIFRGDDYRDKGWKSMVLAGTKDKGFRILAETWSPL